MTCRTILGNLFAGIVLACLLSTYGISASSNDYSKMSITELIDSLGQIDSRSPGIDTAAEYDGFIADGNPGSFEVGVLGFAPPKVPPQMRELVRRGPVALPDLIRHLDDRRPTKLEVGNGGPGSSHRVGLDVFMFSYFGDEYDPRAPHWLDQHERKREPRPMRRFFEARYTVKIGDVCYVLIGQIVNRGLVAVRYQPSGGLVVNSPIEAPVLIEKVRKDWGGVDAEGIKASLLADVRANYPRYVDKAENTARFVNPALQRLRLYFPDTYNALAGEDLRKRKEFESCKPGKDPFGRC